MNSSTTGKTVGARMLRYSSVSACWMSRSRIRRRFTKTKMELRFSFCTSGLEMKPWVRMSPGEGEEEASSSSDSTAEGGCATRPTTAEGCATRVFLAQGGGAGRPERSSGDEDGVAVQLLH